MTILALRSVAARISFLTDQVAELDPQLACHFRVYSADSMVDLVGHDGVVLFSVSELAGEALEFIAGTGAFYVRELPGDLTDDEKVGLIATLVDDKLLRVC